MATQRPETVWGMFLTFGAAGFVGTGLLRLDVSLSKKNVFHLQTKCFDLRLSNLFQVEAL